MSQKTKKDREKTIKLIEELREKVAKIIHDHPGIAVWNADQMGMVKVNNLIDSQHRIGTHYVRKDELIKFQEQHGRRTLAAKGVKKVEVLVQSTSATTHSITILPILGMDGYQKPKVFVQLGEPSGRLPNRGCFVHPTLEIAVGTSHMMSVKTALDFYRNVLFSGPLPPKILLILDSWPAFNDHQSIRNCCPPGTELFIVNIPSGGTSLCQPADLSYNHYMKAIQRHINSLVMIRRIPYRMSQRDNLLRFVCQLHWTLGADRFKPLISYGFYKGGFLSTHPPPFVSPKKYLFGQGSDAPCSDCQERGCTLCPRCSKPFCFNCYWEKLHRC